MSDTTEIQEILRDKIQTLYYNYAEVCRETLRKMMTPNKKNIEIIDTREKLEAELKRLQNEPN
jgi:hypothetical protein